MDAAQTMIEEGRAARDAGNLARARERYQAAADVLRGIDAPLRLAHTVRHMADIEWKMGKFEPARKNYAEALAIYRGDPHTGKLDLANALRGYALLLESLEEKAVARAMWDEARALYAEAGIQAGVDEADKRIDGLISSEQAG